MTAIHLIVTGRNTLPFLDRNLSSIRENLDSVGPQHSARCTWVDDASDDGTAQASLWVHRHPRLTRLHNASRRGGLRNIERAIKATRADEVVVVLDGDDWFAVPTALQRIADEFTDPDCWVTYGSMAIEPPTLCLGNEPYPDEVLRDGTFRAVGWRCFHPKAFRAWLFQTLSEEELRDDDGNPWEGAKDQAFMLPILEMAGRHVRHIPDILHTYNHANPSSYHHVDVDKQTAACMSVRARAPRSAAEKALA